MKLREEEYKEVSQAMDLELAKLGRMTMEQLSAWKSTHPSPMLFKGTSKTYASKATEKPFYRECKICSKRCAGQVFCADCLERKV